MLSRVILPLSAVLASTSLVTAQDKYGQATCTTTVSQTSFECCGTIAGSTTTSYKDCGGCVPTSEPYIACNCLVAPFTDTALTSTATACKPTATPTLTKSIRLPPDVAAYCKDRAFPAIFPPTPEQQCCEGNFRYCKGLITKTTSTSKTTKSPIPVPSQCAYTKCKANSACAKCCAGNLRLCDGVFPLPSSSPEPQPEPYPEPTPSGVPAWCDGLSFTLQYPPTPEQECCAGDLEKCKGLTGPTKTTYPPCQTTITKTARPCGDCNLDYETTATISLDCNGCALVTETVTPGGAGPCVCPTGTQTSVFACATSA